MVGTINIIGEIGIDVTLKDVIRQVKSQSKSVEFIVNIDSDGGSYFVGFDIYNYLRALSDKGILITTIGRGRVCSIATVVFLAGDIRKVVDNTLFMIHLPMLITSGDAKRSRDLLEDANTMQMLEDEILDFYSLHTNFTREELAVLIEIDDLFLTHQELYDFGFTTENEAIRVVAKLNLNKMSKKKGLLERVNAMLRGNIVMKTLKTADQEDLVFEGVDDDADVKVGDKATLDGEPADGDVVLADGRTFVFEAGELVEIIEADGGGTDEELEVLEEKLDEVLEIQETIIEVLEEVQEEVEAIEEEIVAKLRNYKAKLNRATKGNSRRVARKAVARKGNANGRLTDLSRGIMNLKNKRK